MQGGGQAAKRDAGGRIQKQVRRRDVRDDVIEVRQQWQFADPEAVAGVDNRGLGADVLRGQERGQQRDVILAVAVSIGEHKIGRVRYDGAGAQKDAHVPDVL